MRRNMYIVIELIPEPCIVTNENGQIKYFDYMDEAYVEARDCQRGIVVNISTGRTC